MKARIELILECADTDTAAIEDLMDFEMDIKRGAFQQDFTKVGVRKVTATFDWLKD